MSSGNSRCEDLVVAAATATHVVLLNAHGACVMVCVLGNLVLVAG